MKQDVITRKIFLNSSRELAQNDICRIATTTVNDHMKQPVLNASPLSVKDYTLAPQQSVSIENTLPLIFVTLIPVTGSFDYCVNDNISYTINPGEAFKTCLHANDRIDVFNLFRKELINFIVVETMLSDYNITTPQTEVSSARDEDPIVSFDINSAYNNLVQINGPQANSPYYIGKFQARIGYSFSRIKPQTNIFVYVIEGAFEIAECLLEDRDGLLLNKDCVCEWEALSNDAILMLIEFPPSM